MKFLHAVGPIAISIAVWPQLIAENIRKIWHIVPSLWQTAGNAKGYKFHHFLLLFSSRCVLKTLFPLSIIWECHFMMPWWPKPRIWTCFHLLIWQNGFLCVGITLWNNHWTSFLEFKLLQKLTIFFHIYGLFWKFPIGTFEFSWLIYYSCPLRWFWCVFHFVTWRQCLTILLQR